jgi:hypothetical protein
VVAAVAKRIEALEHEASESEAQHYFSWSFNDELRLSAIPLSHMPLTLGNEDLTVQYKVMDNLHQAFLILSSAGMSA